MTKRRRFGSWEINLTSLLDVLFCILFIVMLANNQNEESMAAQSQAQIDQLKGEIAELENQITVYHNQMGSYDLYYTEAVIVSVQNVLKNGSHHLIISKGLEKEEIAAFPMGLDRLEYIKQRIRSEVTKLIEAADEQPIYIVFYCDTANIYTRESHAVRAVLEELQQNNKEVFFKYGRSEVQAP